ncbi:MAG: hypothetical protein AAF750_00810 [Planctomycetota bacterium]
MPAATYSHHPLPTGPRFTEFSASDYLADEPSLGRQRLINRVRQDIHSGAYDDPETVARRLDACLDGILSDLASGH